MFHIVPLHPEVGQHEAEQGHHQQPHRGHHCERERIMGNIKEVVRRKTTLTHDLAFRA